LRGEYPEIDYSYCPTFIIAASLALALLNRARALNEKLVTSWAHSEWQNNMRVCIHRSTKQIDGTCVVINALGFA